MIRARQECAYADVSHYSRELWFIGFEGSKAAEGYVVDLFRVSGGTRHEYALNGDANRDSEMITNIALTDYGPYLVEGRPDIIEPKQETDYGGTSDNQYYGYIYVKDVREAQVPDGTYELTMTTKSAAAADKSNLHIYGFAGSGSNRLFIGKSPSLRSTRVNGLNSDTNTEAVKYDLPKFILRKEGTDLRSQFIHVMEPYAAGANARIDSAEVLLSDETTGEAVIAVSYGNTTDFILSSPNNGGQPLAVGDMTLIGKMGFIRTENGAVTKMYAAGGSLLQKGSVQLTGAGTVSGDISKVTRGQIPGETDAFVTTAIVPASAVGRYVFVTHPDQTGHAYRITGVTRDETQGVTTIAIDSDPGFAYMSDETGPARPSQMLYYPATKWKGTHTFRIDLIAQL